MISTVSPQGQILAFHRVEGHSPIGSDPMRRNGEELSGDDDAG